MRFGQRSLSFIFPLQLSRLHIDSLHRHNHLTLTSCAWRWRSPLLTCELALGDKSGMEGQVRAGGGRAIQVGWPTDCDGQKLFRAMNLQSSRKPSCINLGHVGARQLSSLRYVFLSDSGRSLGHQPGSPSIHDFYVVQTRFDMTFNIGINWSVIIAHC